ncbi:MAG: hypothetical protein WCR46_18115 [Deltaproteobacteria bacterium]|jgi:hypothetical protein
MKEKLGAINVLYPTPTILVGAMVNGKPNFITIDIFIKSSGFTWFI